MHIFAIYGGQKVKINDKRYNMRIHYPPNINHQEQRISGIKRMDTTFSVFYGVERVQIVHSSYTPTDNIGMESNTITRLVNLGIVEEYDGVVTLTDKYMKYLDDVCKRLIKDGYCDASLDPYSFMLDSNAYAITSWVGIIRESELVEMLAAVMCIWREMVVW